jgi:hypothetical protein
MVQPTTDWGLIEAAVPSLRTKLAELETEIAPTASIPM